MLVINQLSMNYGGQTLFDEVSLNLAPKHRYGIVGANGSGKSTLLRIISGEECASGGTVEAANKGQIGFLKQDQFKYEDQLIVEVVMQGRQALWAAMQEKEQLLKLAELSVEQGMRLAHLESEIAQQDGYMAETIAQTILSGLGIPEEKHFEEMRILSGGFKIRVLLAQTLFSMPDVLLLDEPTNHLDIVAIWWLEEYLVKTCKGVLLIVSHDHTFLNNLATHILDIDYGTIKSYKGDYDAFIAAKSLEYEQKLIEQKESERKIAHMQSFVDRFKAKATKARQAQSRVKMIEKMDMPEIIASSRQAPHFKFETKRPSGKQVLSAKKISKSFAEHPVLQQVGFQVERQQKVGIIGPNGIGKSTLLKILMGALEADEGEFEWGYETQISYFAQDHHEILKEPISIFDWLLKQPHGADDKAVRGALGSVLFTKDDVHKRLQNLSGGEAARVLFANMRLAKGNVLVLDEPTNHLDMESIEALGGALQDYDGSLLLVSHDRHFIQQVCDTIIVITTGRIYQYELTHGLTLESVCLKHFE